MSFWTLLGPDYAGKSAVLTSLRTADGWRVISYDDHYVAEDFPFVQRLRREWVSEVFQWAGRRYSVEFVTALMHAIVVHLRDEVDRHVGADRVIVDSYYYKILSKCRVSGVGYGPTLDLWRTYPQPHTVLWLDVTAECAWERAGNGAELNAFEHYGDAPTWQNFARFHRDVCADMRREIRHLPVVSIDANGSREDVLAQVRAAVRAAQPTADLGASSGG